MSFDKTIHDFTVRLGQRSPRLQGLMFAGSGLAVLGMNLAFLIWNQRFYTAANILGFILVPAGLWIAGTGRTYIAGFDKPPLWWTVGITVFTMSGLAFGFYISMRMRQ